MASGIDALKVLSTLQAAAASEDAQDASNKGRELLIKQKNVRARQQAFERSVADKELTSTERASLEKMMEEIGMNTGTLDSIQGTKIDSGSKDDAARENANRVETLRKEFEGELKEIESQERLDNFGIQELMSRYNQAEQLAASIEKKDSEAKTSVIGKI